MQDQRPLIVLDPGHGGSDPGAVNGRLSLRESDINLQLADRLERLAPAAGFCTITTRDGDHFKSLSDRVALANVLKPALFLSLHCNAAEDARARGFEVWTSPGPTGADAVATAIWDALLDVTPFGRKDLDDGDPDKEGNLYVLRHTISPAVLVEFGFLSNDEEARDLANKGYQAQLIMAVLEGLKRLK